MNLAEATAADLAAIVALEESFPARERWSEASWRGELDGDRRLTLVARDADVLVGVAAFEVGPDVADLHRIVVHPAYRRRGAAESLLAEGVERLGSRVLLEVRDDNAPARALYEKHGFRVIDRRADYYGAGVDALVYEREAT
ncbi:MAG: GNAT family N-acetyltransferase [Propionibacterium sp.]|nr:GNAT family N-acetyltransferase [Propionibacterium sp.]